MEFWLMRIRGSKDQSFCFLLLIFTVSFVLQAPVAQADSSTPLPSFTVPEAEAAMTLLTLERTLTASSAQSPIYSKLTSDDESEDDVDFLNPGANSTQSSEPVKVELYTHECARCGHRFETKDRLKHHVIQQHIHKLEHTVCLHCDEDREFFTNHSFTVHTLKKHFHLPLSVCENCNKSFLFDCERIFHKAGKECKTTDFINL